MAMTDSDIVERLRRIDALQEKISEIIHDIRQGEHPRADEIAEALYEQCWFPASAEHVCIDYLDRRRWAIQKYPSGTYGSIVSRQQARKRGLVTVD